jgi:hypothetical protein
VPFLKPPAPIPKGNRRKVHDILCNFLRGEGTVLRRYVRTWQLGDGSDNDLVEPRDWTADLCPVFRVRMEGTPGHWRNQVTTASPVLVAITIGIQGDDPRDAWDVWEVVEQRVFPGDMSLYPQLKPLGVVAYSINQPAVSSRTFVGGRGQHIEGQLKLDFEYRTKY